MDRHLGGYIVGGDEATIYPDLWRWFVEEEGVKSVLDVGCGDGVAVRAFLELGCTVLGVDGVPQGDPHIICFDYTTGPLGPEELGNPPFDLAWSCEFVEHVEEQYVPNFLASFRSARMVAMTHADPGQPGYHHVNCQPAAYWIGVMQAHGFRLDGELTHNARNEAAKNPSPWNHFVRSGLVFRR